MSRLIDLHLGRVKQVVGMVFRGVHIGYRPKYLSAGSEQSKQLKHRNDSIAKGKGCIELLIDHFIEILAAPMSTDHPEAVSLKTAQVLAVFHGT